MAGGRGGPVGRRWRRGVCDCTKNWVMYVCMAPEWCCRPLLLCRVRERAAAGDVMKKAKNDGQPTHGGKKKKKKRNKKRWHEGKTETKKSLEKKNGHGTTLSVELC
jgi:hypothetical protein